MRAFVRLLVGSGASLALFGCPKPERQSAPASSSAAAAAARADTSAPSPVATPRSTAASDAGALDRAARQRFAGHVARGRKHADASQWADAVRAFEAAVAIDPGDARAQSELGWAAFNAGDLSTARRATQVAVTAASDRVVKAQSLYNAGRIAEASDDPAAAERAYRQSLSLRPSDAVEKRLASLGAGRGGSDLTSTGTTCVKAASIADLCTCIVDEVRASRGRAEGGTCGERAEPRLAGTNFVLLHHAIGPAPEAEWTFAAAKVEGGYLVAAEIEHAENPGAFGITETSKLGGVEVRKIGDKRVVIFKAEHSHHRMNQVGGDDESEARTVQTFCLADRASRPCPLAAPLVTTYLHERLDLQPIDDFPDEVRRTLASLPVRKKTRVEATLGPDLVVDVVLKEGRADDLPRGLLGRHSLR
ncbi:MAG: hypothetical protein JNL38_34970 [Myxococcales bacterium]|nr:hypothetical protein [Myxococcales bacterium]